MTLMKSLSTLLESVNPFVLLLIAIANEITDTTVPVRRVRDPRRRAYAVCPLPTVDQGASGRQRVGQSLNGNTSVMGLEKVPL